ncbi:Autoinducer 2 sensor kinase/phosphatase LuxQ [compost metagenome]
MVQIPSKGERLENEGNGSVVNFGSYRLRILINPTIEQSYGLRFPNQQTGSELFVNGRSLAKSGQPAPNAEQHMSGALPLSASFVSNEEEIEIVVHVSQFDYSTMKVFNRAIKFGTESAVNSEKWLSYSMQLLLSVILVIHGLYAALVYYLGTRQKVLVYFSLLLFCTVCSVLVDDDQLLLLWLPINAVWSIKIAFLSYTGLAVSMLLMTLHMFPEYLKVKIFRWYLFLCLLYSVFILLMPSSFVSMNFYLMAFILLVPAIVISAFFMRIALKGERDVIFLLISATAITTNIVWGLIKNIYAIDVIFYPFDLIVCFFSFAAYWFRRYFRNAVETKELAEKLQKTDRLKDDFLANTSHELRNPLHGMINIAQSILDNDRKSLNDKSTQSLDLLIFVGRRMSFILNDLLDLKRLKESGIHIQPSRVRVQSVASGVLDMLRYMTEGKPVRLILDISDSFPSVWADENRLTQILFNLIHNAIKFTSEGSITIQAYTRLGTAYITVADTGIGLDHETQSRVFEAYEQGNSDMTAIAGGIGLGLSISKQLVELHGGTIQVNSQIGQGSVFTFTLPLLDEANREQEAACEQPDASVYQEAAAAKILDSSNDLPVLQDAQQMAHAVDRPRILAVDDDLVNLKIIESILTIGQYEVVTATNAGEAISKLDAGRWDLVISDVMMPQVSGYELTRTIRDRFSISQLPILLLTARSRAEDIDTGFLAGANDYVTKPMDALELRSRVRSLTDLRRSVDEGLRMEAAWLQAQIQPHFLFNTLNSIAALSDIDIQKMQRLLEVFGEYLRISFDFLNSERLVPVEHELMLVRSYLYIEQERFGDRLEVSWELDEIKDLQLPPLSIQPIVENAVRHGVLKRSQGGQIHIRILNQGTHTEVTVSDNGVGMDEAKLRQLLTSESALKRGIGLRNTDRRLRQMYGNGLQIQSYPDQGTTITFTIPLTST